jgi:hypothetical protein
LAGGEDSGCHPRRFAAENQLVTKFFNSARLAVMLQVVAPYVAEMLHLKLLTINRVAGVAGF